MDAPPVEILYYQTEAGRKPFKEWLDSLDTAIQVVVDARLTRIRRGLFGDAKILAGGLWEIRFDLGPGYRLYLAKDGKTIVILLNGGHKKGQQADIGTARDYLADYLRRTRT